MLFFFGSLFSFPLFFPSFFPLPHLLFHNSPYPPASFYAKLPITNSTP